MTDIEWKRLYNKYTELLPFKNFIEKYIHNNKYIPNITETQLLKNLGYLLEDEVDLVRTYNIFIPKGVYIETDEFKNIVKPIIFVREDDCGIKLKGIHDIKNDYIKIMYIKLIKESLRYSSLDYTVEKNEISFVNPQFKSMYKKADWKAKEKFCDYILRNEKYSVYCFIYDFIMKGIRFDVLDNGYGVSVNTLLSFFIKQFGFSKEDASKILLINGTSMGKLFGINKNSDMGEYHYMFDESLNTYDNSYLLFLNYNLGFDTKNAIIENKVTMLGNGIYQILYKYCNDKLEKYLKEHLAEMFFYLSRYLHNEYTVICASKSILEPQNLHVSIEMRQDSVIFQYR